VQVNYSFNNAWAGLLNKCLESREPQFTYKFCFFDKATQIDNGGGHETNLGFWKGFEKGGTEVGLQATSYILPVGWSELRREKAATTHAVTVHSAHMVLNSVGHPQANSLTARLQNHRLPYIGS
jgi:hypothetical protein